MPANYTAVVQQDGEWWIGWVEEVPGVNSQGQRAKSCWTICPTPSPKHGR